MNRLPIALIALVTASAAATAPDASTQATNKPTITVHGDAVVKVAPDKVSILIGAESRHEKVEAARQMNTDVVARIRQVLRDMKIDDDDVRTDHVSMQPEYRYRDGNVEEIAGYIARSSIHVTLTDPAKLEDVIAAVLDAGATHIHDVQFETTEFKRHREQARLLALQAAREKAEKMAAVLGRRIGDPLIINEVKSYRPWWYHGSWWGNSRNFGMYQNVMQSTGAPAADSPGAIALGRISIEAAVSVTFALE